MLSREPDYPDVLYAVSLSRTRGMIKILHFLKSGFYTSLISPAETLPLGSRPIFPHELHVEHM